MEPAEFIMYSVICFDKQIMDFKIIKTFVGYDSKDKSLYLALNMNKHYRLCNNAYCETNYDKCKCENKNDYFVLEKEESFAILTDPFTENPEDNLKNYIKHIKINDKNIVFFDVVKHNNVFYDDFCFD